AGTIGMRGTVPVDDAQNVYISGGATGKDVVKVAPDRTATTLATLNEAIVSLVRGSGNVIYALTTTNLYRIATTGTATTTKSAPLPQTFALTIDGKHSLYVQFLANVINMYRADGTVSNVLRPDSTGAPAFEYEGMNVAGDCADNLFLTPFTWPAVGQQSAE